MLQQTYIYIRVVNRDFLQRRASGLRDKSVPKAINDSIQELQAILQEAEKDPVLKEKISAIRIKTF